ncbi:hypothetical protein GCM10009543_09990 [Leifsonia naganoensis]
MNNESSGYSAPGINDRRLPGGRTRPLPAKEQLMLLRRAHLQDATPPDGVATGTQIRPSARHSAALCIGPRWQDVSSGGWTILGCRPRGA